MLKLKRLWCLNTILMDSQVVYSFILLVTIFYKHKTNLSSDKFEIERD